MVKEKKVSKSQKQSRRRAEQSVSYVIS
jgi:hypothetical protein